MKTFVFSVAVAATIITACSNNNSAKEAANKNNDSAASTTQTSNTANSQPASVDDALNAYLQIKNALANDDGKGAAAGGSAFVQAIDKITPSLKTNQKEAADDAKEMAEHISKSADRIAHQREHFEMLSNDMYDMVKAASSSKTLYKDFCPMYNNKKGANWLSETKEIKNPYMGKEMQTCGEVKEEIKK